MTLSDSAAAEHTTRFDPQRLRTAYSAFPSGVVALCGIDKGQPIGMAVSAFTSVSLAPPLVSVCIQKTSQTWPVLRGVRRLGVSVLGTQHTAACQSLSMKDGDRFTDIDWRAHEDDSIVINDASAWMITSIVNEIEAGDHLVAILQVHAIDADLDVDPLVFHASGFHRPTPLAAKGFQ